MKPKTYPADPPFSANYLMSMNRQTKSDIRCTTRNQYENIKIKTKFKALAVWFLGVEAVERQQIKEQRTE